MDPGGPWWIFPNRRVVDGLVERGGDVVDPGGSAASTSGHWWTLVDPGGSAAPTGGRWWTVVEPGGRGNVASAHDPARRRRPCHPKNCPRHESSFQHLVVTFIDTHTPPINPDPRSLFNFVSFFDVFSGARLRIPGIFMKIEDSASILLHFSTFLEAPLRIPRIFTKSEDVPSFFHVFRSSPPDSMDFHENRGFSFNFLSFFHVFWSSAPNPRNFHENRRFSSL